MDGSFLIEELSLGLGPSRAGLQVRVLRDLAHEIFVPRGERRLAHASGGAKGPQGRGFERLNIGQHEGLNM